MQTSPFPALRRFYSKALAGLVALREQSLENGRVPAFNAFLLSLPTHFTPGSLHAAFLVERVVPAVRLITRAESPEGASEEEAAAFAAAHGQAAEVRMAFAKTVLTCENG